MTQRIVTATATQEWFESGSGEARKRARALRKAGWACVVSSMGPQVTEYGVIRMTMITIPHIDRNPCPSQKEMEEESHE